MVGEIMEEKRPIILAHFRVVLGIVYLFPVLSLTSYKPKGRFRDVLWYRWEIGFCWLWFHWYVCFWRNKYYNRAGVQR